MSAAIYPIYRSLPSTSHRTQAANETGPHGPVNSQLVTGHVAGSTQLRSQVEVEPAVELTPPRSCQAPNFHSWPVEIAEWAAALSVIVAMPIAAIAALAAAVGFHVAGADALDSAGRVLPLLTALMAVCGGRRLADRGATYTELAARSALSASFAAIVLLATSFFLLSDAVAICAICAAFVAVAPLCGLLARLTLGSDFVAQRLRRNVAIFGSGPQARELIASIQKFSDRRLAGIFDERQNMRLLQDLEPRIGGNLDDLVELVARGLVDEVILALPPKAASRTQQICNRFRELPVDVIAADTTLLPPSEAENGERLALAGQTMTRIHRRPIKGWGAIGKAAFDRPLAAFALIVLAPVFAAIALAIKIDSPGPVFFRQRRHGLCGQTIVVWKFRTMRVMEDGAVVLQASKSDDRVTLVGRFLRRTSMDELPQLVNVLNGSMSIVGPRPHAIAHDEHYAALLPTYAQRSIVRPGITGWAQINGLRGETRTQAEMAARLQHDLWYVANWSLWLDLRIILLTPIYGLVHKNAY